MTADGFHRPRCKRRDCPRCWALRSRETARCLVLDAREEMPTVCMTLTTAEPWEQLDPAAFRLGVADVFRRLRRLYGRVEYFAAVEFTTGRAERSGGRRRLHAHLLVKGLDGDLVLEVERRVRETWETATGAWRVEVAALVSAGAALGYLALHHRKPEQAPPATWRGMTERASKGYWSRPISELREQARSELAVEAHAWWTGLSITEAAIALALRDPSRLVEVRRLGDAEVLEPMGEFAGRLPEETRLSLAEVRRLALREGVTA